MARYALVDPSNTIVRKVPDTRVDPTVPTKAGWRWLLCVPVVNDTRTPGNTFTISTQSDVIVGNTVEERTTLRDMDASETAARKTQIVNSVADELQFRHLFDLENRMRTLEGRNTITVAQYKNALEGLL